MDRGAVRDSSFRNSQAKDVRLTPEQTEQVVEAIAIALGDAELTIDELSEAVIDGTGPWAET